MEQPLYLTPKQAAKFVGIGLGTMLGYLESDDPPPYMMVGNRRMLQTAGLAPYFERKQEVRL